MEKNITPTEYRLILRERILQVARALFRERGIKAVKMDDIARQLSISKRTLYELFRNKEELLYECVKAYHEASVTRFREATEKGKTVIDILVDIYKLQMEEFSRTKPIFSIEINKYPGVLSYLERHHEDQKNKAVGFLRMGAEQGYFRTDVNYEVVSRIANASMEYVMKSKMYNDFPLSEIFRNVQLMFIRGICTDKGLKILDEKIAAL